MLMIQQYFVLIYCIVEKMKRSLFATYVDKDTGKDSLVEKIPDAKEIVLRQHNFQWYVQQWKLYIGYVSIANVYHPNNGFKFFLPTKPNLNYLICFFC